MSATPYWLVMPAAGRGERVGAERPKQYLPLAGRTMIEWSLAPFVRDPDCRGIVVALAPGDPFWAASCADLGRPVIEAVGGATRAESVAAGLAALAAAGADDDDWVLVHDAARPCVSVEEIAALRAAVQTTDDALCAILALPLADTLKRGEPRSDGRVHGVVTLPRESLWRALTPQMARLGALRAALAAAAADGRSPTDEAQALEWRGSMPLLVPGASTNLKVTTLSDARLAAAILAARAAGDPT